MKKREFLKLSSIAGAGVMVAPFLACNGAGSEHKSDSHDATDSEESPNVQAPNFTLPALGYGFEALQPSIDAMTMEIHHDKHHGGYVRKLNAALTAEGTYAGESLEALLADVDASRTGVRNNGGGHYNHSLFWKVIAPGGGSRPTGQLGAAINAAFGSYEQFAEAFFKAAKTRFGSGWAWLSVDANGKLFVSSTPNQDNPLMTKLVDGSGTPVLGIDVWEHAYYLNYQNERGRYINAFMEIINWEQVAANFQNVMA